MEDSRNESKLDNLFDQSKLTVSEINQGDDTLLDDGDHHRLDSRTSNIT